MACRRGPMLTRRPKSCPLAAPSPICRKLSGGEPSLLTGDARIDGALLALARLLADIVGNPRAISPSNRATEEDDHEDGHA